LGDNMNSIDGGIDSAIQVGPIAGDLYIRFVDPPGPIRRAQLPANPLIQNGSVPLDPPPNRDVVNGQASFRHHLLQVTVGERISQIPSDTENNHDVLEMSTTEQCRPPLPHRVTISDRQLGFATEPS
jgi:hypothetical protein